MHSIKEMPYNIGIVMKIYPSCQQKHIVSVNDGAQRFVYNRLVGTGNEIYKLKKVEETMPWVLSRIDYLESVRETAAGIKNAAPFLYEKDVDSDVVYHAIKNYHSAWKNMHERHTGVPTFHKKGYAQSYQTSNHYKGSVNHMNGGSIRFADKKHIVLPKIGKIRIGISPKLIDELLKHADSYESRIGTVTVSKDAVGEYWVSMSIASMQPFRKELAKTGGVVGIDLNIENFLTDSNNKVVENPRILKGLEKKLAKAQRKMSRKAERAKKEGRSLRESKNYQKDRIKVAAINRKIARRRDNFQHEVSKSYVESQDLIVAEDLKVRNMKKNHCLAKAISDAGWRSFITKLDYKSKLYGKEFALIDPKNTTQTCSACGYTLTGDDKLTLNDREWVCPSCGKPHKRDHNSAINILNRYLTSKSC